MCYVLGIARSTYYQSLDRTLSVRDSENRKITKRIIQIHKDSNKRYGAPKIHYILKEEYLRLSLVQRLMKREGIRSIITKKYRPYPSKEQVVECKNVLIETFILLTAIKQK